MDMPVKHKKPSIAAQAAAREARLPKLPENLPDGLVDRPMSAMEVEDLIDAFGKAVIERQGANLFFQLISRRYEKGPMILTSNQSFGSWSEVFGNRVIATAILDRVLHHAIPMNIRGNSYRLKDKLKAGLVRSAETPTVE